MSLPRIAVSLALMVGVVVAAPPASAETAVVRVAELGPDHPRATNPDVGGRATTSLELYRDSGQLCWSIRFEHMEVRQLAVFRESTVDEAIMLYDEAPSNGPTLSGCRPVDPALVGEVADAPERFYVRSQSYAGRDVAGTPTLPRSATAGPARSTGRACPPGSVPEDGFRDVPEGSAHEANVDCVVWWGVASGRSRDAYDPAGTVTRGQLATFLASTIRSAHGQLPAASQDWFADDNGSPHEPAINALRQQRILDGVAEGTFRPDAPVTRGAMATFLARVHAYRTGERLQASADYFSDDDGTVHELSTNAVAEAGIASGTSGGGYAPAAPVRRDAMASFVARLLDLWVEQGRTSAGGSGA